MYPSNEKYHDVALFPFSESQKMPSVCLLYIVALLTITAANEDVFNSTRCSLAPSGDCNGDDYSYNCSYSTCDAFPRDIDPKVREIRLRGNEIQAINKTLRNYKQLQMLDLSENRVNVIEAGSFPYTLVFLNLSSNDITLDAISSQRVFDNLGKLEYLSLANNKLENLTVQSIFSPWLPKIRHLDLSGNRIEFLAHNVITDMNFLEVLDLSDNLISDPDSSDFLGLYRLEVLNMTRNKLEFIPDLMFMDMLALRTVDLSDNLIDEISEKNFERTKTLETLHLERNRIEALPKGLCIHMKSLTSLHLDENPLKSVESGSLTPTLKTLSIRDCDHLEQVEEAIDGQASLEEVIITGNGHLYSIAERALGTNSTARHVDLSYNALTTLSEHLLEWNDVTTADLSGNFWDCDCRMLWAKRLPASSPVRESIR